MRARTLIYNIHKSGLTNSHIRMRNVKFASQVEALMKMLPGRYLSMVPWIFSSFEGRSTVLFLSQEDISNTSDCPIPCTIEKQLSPEVRTLANEDRLNRVLSYIETWFPNPRDQALSWVLHLVGSHPLISLQEGRKASQLSCKMPIPWFAVSN